MSAIKDFFKDIFMLAPEKGLVGLTGIKSVKKSAKKSIAKSSKKSEPNLSELMRKSYKKLEV
ncbi:MAG: hypothetical protein ACI37Z_09350 [Candidatus Gastranaerophilaceae bacterium]